MKVKLYIEKILLKVGLGVCGFIIFTFTTFTTTHVLAGGTEDALFEALGEEGSLSGGSSDDKGARGVESKAVHFKLSEALWKSSEVASEHAASGFMMDKLDVFENGGTFQFAQEDYFDDFKENYEKGTTEDKVAKDILRDNEESKIERIAAAAERGERRRAEKAERNEDKVEKAEVKEEKKVEKAEAKVEVKEEAKVEEEEKDKKDDGDGGKKEKGK